MTALLQTQGDWKTLIKGRIEERQAGDTIYAELIEQYKNLASNLRYAKQRNAAFLASSQDETVTAGPSSAPVSKSYLATLTAQLTTLRTELSGLHRTLAQSQSKQLGMAEVLREKDEEVRVLKEEVRREREGRERGERREKEWGERWRMKEEDLQTLHDELLSLNLELTQLSHRNTALQADNASLLQRWLDRMNEEVERKNGEFEREVGEKEKGAGDGEGDGK